MAYHGAAFKSKIPVAVRFGRENRVPSFGEKLKLEREKRAITLEQISLSTKIGTRMLQALEEEKFNQLPGGIFNRGFVRAYARHVGLDEEQTIADYLEASGEGPPPKPDAVMDIAPPPAETPVPSSSRQLPWGMLAAILLLVALALSLWSRRQHRHEGQPVQSPAAPTATPKPRTETSSPAGSQASPSDRGTLRASAPAKQAEVSAFSAPASGTGRNAASIAAAVTQAAASPGEFTVVILAREDSWLSITADGQAIFADTLVEGYQRAVHGRKEVVIRAGNTGALDFVFNGKKLDPQGDYGEVKTLTFGSGGLRPNPPIPPVTQ
ncbi:MAG: RodZ domain-containing protein [Terriglobales bacterium]